MKDFTHQYFHDIPITCFLNYIIYIKSIIKILDEFSENINDFKKAIIEKNSEKLLKIFASTKNVRKEIIKAGQDVKSPDFGRKKD